MPLAALYTPEQFAIARCREKLPMACSFCKSVYQVNKHYILERIRKGRTESSFCSYTCQNLFKRTLVTLTCSHCGSTFNRSKSAAYDSRTKSARRFCTSRCSGKYNRLHKTIGIRRSKLEVFVENRLIEMYPNLEIHFNRKDTIESELDIYIPSLKLAFELNGPTHYKPIYGEEKFREIQLNDKKKCHSCKEKGIELQILDVSKFQHTKDEHAIPYLEKLTVAINDKKLTI